MQGARRGVLLDGGAGQIPGWAARAIRDVEEEVGRGAPLSLPSPARVPCVAELGTWQAI